jgi:hypothetical protein
MLAKQQFEFGVGIVDGRVCGSGSRVSAGNQRSDVGIEYDGSRRARR